MRNLFQPDLELSLPPLRAWQERCVPQIRQAVKEGHKRIVIQCPTGGGKTLLAAHLFANSISKGKRPMFAVPDITLVEQTLQSFERVGITDIGVIQAQHTRTDWNAQVQIASIASLVRRELPDVDLIVIDEAHVQWAKLYELMDGPVWADKIMIGLSATPWAKGMGLHWTKLIVAATIKELIDEKILCGFRVYVPAEEVDRSKVHIVKGEFDEGEASIAMREKRIVGDVVKTWQEKWNQDRTFMFCVDRAHAKEQQAAFEQAGIPFGYIDGTMLMEWRRPVFEAFRERRIKGIASVGCLSRGVDEDVHCIIDAQLTNSEMNLVQKVGRGLRNPHGNDKELLILDHAGNALNLGLVTDIYHDRLDSRKPADKEAVYASDNKPSQPRKCPQCHCLIPYAVAKCPVCGFVSPVKSKVEHQAGELVELSSKTKKPRLERSEEQAFYSGLLDFAMRRGFKEGWAANKFREKFGVWPNRLYKVPMTPRKAVKEFIKESGRQWRQQKKQQSAAAVAGDEYQGEF